MKAAQVTVTAEADGVGVVVCSGEFDLDTTGLLIGACEVQPVPASLLVVDVR